MSSDDNTPAASGTSETSARPSAPNGAEFPQKPHPSRQNKQLFISYSRSDRLAVDQIIRDLRKQHYVLWMDVDEQGIEPGETWRSELKQQMTNSEGVIACVSPDFLRSPYCLEEIEQAKQEGKAIYPVLVRRLDSGQDLKEIGLDHLQYVDLTQGYEQGLRRLMQVLPRPRFPARLVAQRVALVLLGLLLLVGIALGGFTLVQQAVKNLEPTATAPPPTPTLQVADYDVGVVVAQFALPDDGSISSADADELIAQFSRLLESELQETMSRLRLTVGVLSPEEVGRIEGDTVSDRRENARDLARSRGADIVVYGSMTRNEVTGEVELQPEYYVVPDSFTDAQEMTGAFRFGRPIALHDPITQALNAEGALSSRTTALAHVVTGLVKYVLQEDYAGALESFESATGVPDWNEQEGREVLHILLGNARLKLAQQAAVECNRAEVLEQVDQAVSEYEQARDLADNYARAYAGLAAATYLQALWTPEENDGCANQLIDLDLLEQTLAHVEQAQTADDQPDEIGVESKVLLTKAQALFWLWNTVGEFSDEEYESLLDDFQRTTERILNNYEEGTYPSVASLAIEAYSLRGAVKQINGDCRAAIGEYANALEIPTISSSRRMFFVGWQGDCYYQLGQSGEAANAYSQALSIAQALGNEDSAAYYESLLMQVHAEIQPNADETTENRIAGGEPDRNAAEGTQESEP